LEKLFPNLQRQFSFQDARKRACAAWHPLKFLCFFWRAIGHQGDLRLKLKEAVGPIG